MSLLFPALFQAATDDSATVRRPALRFGTHALSHGELAVAARRFAARVREAADGGRVAVWATPVLETAVGVVAALEAGLAVVPLNPRSGKAELEHILADSAPRLLLAAPGEELPRAVRQLRRLDVTIDTGIRTGTDTGTDAGIDLGGDLGGGETVPALDEPNPESPAFVVYTSGTTGPPKGAVIPRRAVAATLDALADAWQWTADDVLVHGLPLFHVHGLILGVLGPLRRGGAVRHLGRFSTEGVARELNSGATMLFGVPTMYHRIAEALPGDPELVRALAGARLLVSGSAALPVHDHERIAAATGRRVVERYGMTETLMNTAVRADGEAGPGTVGLPLPGVELRLVEEDGTPIAAYDGETVGEIQVRGPNLFTGYLHRPDATAGAFTADGWFRTGDMAVRDPDGYVRIVGRKATDLIKSGGYKIGAGEIENALLEHPGVSEAAVTGEPDADLGERVVAWVVATDPASPPAPEALAAHVAERLAPHKRPRVVHYLDALPRNDMGKLLKRALRTP
ncbi:malonyl-CoA/methylmalonyl-CoA synthetase [Streptomyces sp. B3I7]|uniref:acyl-CoA synthetase n=1 Tax=Streptomyces sp. B3I7 TaxID=3042269 RepID=UPI0027876C3A|nr:acyl-CoA synthetase [Streptomyces sp. B3I7]MDQ0813588.1 malonyl-CoA/methylmalonyl-CoA synthetase [Streptomyces sp. B3I7]